MLIIFDCDGVLVDSEILAKKVELAIYGEHGFESSLDAFSERFSGMTGDEIMREIAEELEIGLPRTLHDDIQTRIDEKLATELEAIADVHDMLDRLDGPRCICSNSSSERLSISLKRTGLMDRFRPYIFSAPEVGTKEPKPSANVFLHAAKALECDPAETIVIEDSVHGIAGAVAAGMRVVGFTGASHTYPTHAEKLMEAGAETTINKLSDFPAVVEALKSWSFNS
ncbi:MAG: HAD-IA family hydrolase [Rhizobiales bacterium]|nr:HAD-IA family hydrolase [Hyphomicrobiales bacterium]